jgi:lincosamide and streptogramin A transport system ATP-binding/permease protein
MSQISINDMEFYYEDFYNPVFKEVNLNLETDWKLGLIGRNGRGKTTLLKLLSSELSPTKGAINTHTSMIIFPFECVTNYTNTLDVIKECIGGVKSIEDEMEECLVNNTESSIKRYNELLGDYIEKDGYHLEAFIRKELNLLELDEGLLKRDFDTLSGGEQTKVLLLSLFLRKDTFLLLDEPTEHLDIENKKIIANYLKHKKGFILVSHDRHLLDESVDHILSINKANITLEKGNFTSWEFNKNKRDEYERRAKINLEKEIKKLEETADTKRVWSEQIEGKKNHIRTHNRGTSSRSKALMKNAKRLEKKQNEDLALSREMLKNFEVADDVCITENLNDVTEMMVAKKISFGYDYPLVEDLSFEIEQGDIIWVKGANGRGKSTLIRVLLGELDLLSGELIKEDIKISFVNQIPKEDKSSIEEISKSLNEVLFMKHLKEFGLEKMRNHPVHLLSKGESKKVDIAKAISTPHHLIILDEPLNHTDIMFRSQLIKAINESNITLLFVEHDQGFGESIATKIIEL